MSVAHTRPTAVRAVNASRCYRSPASRSTQPIKSTLSTPSKMSILKLKMHVMVAALHWGGRPGPVRVLILGYLDRHDGTRVPRFADGRHLLRGRLRDDLGHPVFALPEHLRSEVHAVPRTDAALPVYTYPHGPPPGYVAVVHCGLMVSSCTVARTWEIS